MNKIGMKRVVLTALSCMAFNSFAAPVQPELTLTPLTNPLVQVPLGETRDVQYQLVNQGNKPHTLSMKPMLGVSLQAAKAGFCKEHSLLKPGQSCVLNLAVDGDSVKNLEKNGPLLCENISNWHDEEAVASSVCVQPKADERLSIQTLAKGSVTLSIEISAPSKQRRKPLHCNPSLAACTLVLFAGTGTEGDLKITNTSRVTALNITATGQPASVSLDDSDCASLPGGGTCFLTFTPGATGTGNAVTPITVVGSNTGASLAANMQVLSIGDLYEGGQLFQLPTNANGFNYYTAQLSDATSSLVDGATAQTLCTGDTAVPPAAQLSELYDASNCAAGPIAGFSCTNSYWSDDGVNGVDFSTGSPDQPDVSPGLGALVRCTTAFVLVPEN